MFRMVIFGIVILFMIMIVISLGFALYYLISDTKRTPRTVKALTVRIVLSVILFGFIIVAAMLGWIQPHGLY